MLPLFGYSADCDNDRDKNKFKSTRTASIPYMLKYAV